VRAARARATAAAAAAAADGGEDYGKRRRSRVWRTRLALACPGKVRCRPMRGTALGEERSAVRKRARVLLMK
jgi:hypothetical protein